MDDYPIKLGSILFTLVEPHRGHEIAYNRWYERDHFYAGCLVGPGILAGARFVATRPYKDLRYPPDSPIGDPARGSYLALYWIERSRQDEWGTWGAREVRRLHEAGRMFPHRDHVHTKMYRYRWGAFRDPDGVPPELSLDRRYPGLTVAFVEARDGVPRDDVAGWLHEDLLPAKLAGSPAAMALSFTPVPIPDDAPADIPRIPADERRILQIFFLEADPSALWHELFAGYGGEVEKGGQARVVWCGAFIPTIPGTDTHADALW